MRRVKYREKLILFTSVGEDMKQSISLSLFAETNAKPHGFKLASANGNIYICESLLLFTKIYIYIYISLSLYCLPVNDVQGVKYNEHNK